MARLLYTVLFYAAQPLVWVRLLWRGRRQPEYRQHIGERYGYYPPAPAVPVVWLHAVSVGETRAAEPLIDALLARYPEHALLLTHMTPTGREAGRSHAARHPGRVIQAYLPYDLPDAARRFLRHFRPQIGLFMETELWPNLIAAAHSEKIPLALVNGRLSARSQRGYQRLDALIRPALQSLALVAAQTAADASRLESVGACSPQVTGNLKFDVTPDPARLAQGHNWRAEIGARPIWLAASTRDGEEALIFDLLAGLAVAKLLLIVVPRHPQRFDEVAALACARGLRLKRRSAGELPDAETQVWLGDSMGEMAAYYAASDLALIGGSLLPFGGQNLIEAATCGCPVLVGPHTFNFAQAAEDAVFSGGALRVADGAGLAEAVTHLLTTPEDRINMKEKAIAFSQAHQGATARTMALLEPLLTKQRSSTTAAAVR